MFTIFDSKVGAYSQPFFSPTKGSALRMFIDNSNSSSSNINKHPEDYTLFQMGDFDDATASYEPLATPLSLGVAIEFINK